ncbi:MAG: DUF2868 domain-containing protein [Verrucomicrobiae bacterium]|nr:DUF2868 domain-containing protein [Verrucomicrobiae bacterium]NNJ87327.1 DUF2868 domain-containing protein [Akkermansiaceae bacterium]
MVKLLKNRRQSGPIVPSGKWSLRDVVDFEALASDSGGWKDAWRHGVREMVESAAPTTEKSRRRLGFRLMLECVRGEASIGDRMVNSARLVSIVLALLMFLAGVGVVRGLLTDYSYEEMRLVAAPEGTVATRVDDPVAVENVTEQARGFNVWIFLAVTLGFQWCLLLAGFLGYWLWRKWTGTLTMLEKAARWGIAKCSVGKIDPGLWNRLKSRARGGRGVFGWRLTRLLQAAGVGYNLGLLAGLFGCLWFMNVGYFWETSLPQFGEQSLNRVTQVMSSPTGHHYPGEQAVEISQIRHQLDMGDFIAALTHSLPPRQKANLNWSIFFFFSLALYGLLPRLLMWVSAWWMERRALAGLDFQESHHRALWREVTAVSRGEVTSTPADGAVVLDVGGLEITTEQLRPYFLRELRVNPEARYSLGTLDEEGEAKAMQAARDAAMGVVFLVEGWNLSPKQMAVYHAQVREAIGERNMIRYLVMGNHEELEQWTVFVDSLKDSEAEVFHFRD